VASHSRASVSRNGAKAGPGTQIASGLQAPRPATLAKVQAFLFFAAGALGVVGVLVPHPAQFNVPGLVSLQLICMVSAAGLFAFANRFPPRLLMFGPLLGTALNSLAVYFSGDASSAYALFYVWVGIYAFYFQSRAVTALMVGWVAVNYGGAILLLNAAGKGPLATGQSNGEIHHFVLTTGTLILAGISIAFLRERVQQLFGSLSEAARTDPLTGLLNRRSFNELLEIELERAERGEHSVSLVIGDCDHFKTVNDRFGHQAGDRALRRVGSLMEKNKRRIDSSARVGGEEFALLLPETDPHEALVLTERIRGEVADGFPGMGPRLTMSYGIASYPSHARTTDALLKAADEALYTAKVLGRDRTVVYSAEIRGILFDGDGAPAKARDRTQLATVIGLAEALDMRDSGTARHSHTVGRYSAMMARELGLPPERVERIRLAGMVHDIGKIAVPDSILRKASPLTEDEYEEIKKHPEAGGRILGGSGLTDIRSWVLAHHERPDGQGYPYGLSDEEIPLEAKIISVADAFEAMTSGRVYREPITFDAAIEELRRFSGTQFDADVAEVFFAAMARSAVREPAAAR
jgi:diguanylate cyclase (GGDEF)-like protein